MELVHRRTTGWNSGGDSGTDPEGLVGARDGVLEGEYPCQQGHTRGKPASSEKKVNFFA